MQSTTLKGLLHLAKQYDFNVVYCSTFEQFSDVTQQNMKQ